VDTLVTDAQACAQPLALDAALAQLSPEIVYVYDMQAQRNVYANLRLFGILGLTPSAVQVSGDTRFALPQHPHVRFVRWFSADASCTRRTARAARGAGDCADRL
jgi:hypothetical protein